MNNKPEAKQRIDLVERINALIEQQNVFRNCTNCDSWNAGKEICDKFQQRPPVEVIIKGCEYHTDEIPF